MSGACIVLNGPSSSGKSSIALAIRATWPRPLQISGIDTFLALQSESFFSIGAPGAAGLSWVPTTIDGEPAFDIHVGDLGVSLLRSAHRYWRSCAEEGVDQIIDDVWMTDDQARDLRAHLAPHDVFYVGVTCDLDERERRELLRGDRPIGTSRGQSAVVHTRGPYDVMVDTTSSTSADCAALIVDAFHQRTLARRTS